MEDLRDPAQAERLEARDVLVGGPALVDAVGRERGLVQDELGDRQAVRRRV